MLTTPLQDTSGRRASGRTTRSIIWNSQQAAGGMLHRREFISSTCHVSCSHPLPGSARTFRVQHRVYASHRRQSMQTNSSSNATRSSATQTLNSGRTGTSQRTSPSLAKPCCMACTLVTSPVSSASPYHPAATSRTRSSKLIGVSPLIG